MAKATRTIARPDAASMTELAGMMSQAMLEIQSAFERMATIERKAMAAGQAKSRSTPWEMYRMGVDRAKQASRALSAAESFFDSAADIPL
jgi:hypothetical protein